MCEHCPLLRTARTQTTSTTRSLRQCHACALPMDDTPPHTVCPGCIIYALLHQNRFIQRWHDIHDTPRPIPPLQQHHSIHNPNAVHLDGAPIPPMPFPTPPPRQVIDLTLYPHATNEIATVFARSTTANSAQVHLSHPHIHITIYHLRRLNLTLQPNDTHHLPLRVIYYHMYITTRAPLIPRNRYLSLTMDNTIHTMTSNETHDPSTRLQYIHLFLNPTTGLSYILYTLDGQPEENPHLFA